MEGVNVLTNTDFGVFIDGAEETIEMFERGELSREDLYSTILDLDVVYRSKDEITGKQKSVESKEED
jgi:hypothetical protein